MTEQFVATPPSEELPPQVIAYNPDIYTPINHEWLEARIGDAIEKTEFAPTPEVRQSIEGFYTDHYLMATAVSEALKPVEPGVRTERDVSTDTESPHAMKKQSEMLTRARQEYEDNPEDRDAKVKLIQEAATTLSMVFTESSIGITTVGDSEIAVREQLGNQILAFAQEHNMLWMFDTGVGKNRRSGHVTDMGTEKTHKFAQESTEAEKQHAKDRPNVEQVDGKAQFNYDPYGDGSIMMDFKLSEYVKTGRINEAKGTFWNDVRQASHLEFHGSGVSGKSMIDGLMSRNEQVRRTGEYTAGTMRDRSGVHHTNVVKFSEYAPSGEYTTYNEETHQQSGRSSPGTYGIPIADIIEVAPFARNAKFAIVSVKNEELAGLHDRVGIPIVDKNIGVGGTENIGTSPNGSRQRAFFASPEEGREKQPDEYRIETTGIGKSGIDPASSTRVLFTYEGGYSNSQWMIPLGYQFPANYTLSLGVNSGGNAEIIRNAQKVVSEHPKFKDKFVVPLRRGVFSFVPEESNHEDYPRAEGRTYTQIAKKSGSFALAS